MNKLKLKTQTDQQKSLQQCHNIKCAHVPLEVTITETSDLSLHLSGLLVITFDPDLEGIRHSPAGAPEYVKCEYKIRRI